MRIVVVLAAVGAANLAPARLAAQVFDFSVNLVANGNFETGTMSGGAPNVPNWFHHSNAFEVLVTGDDGSTGQKCIGFLSHIESNQNDGSTWAIWQSSPLTVVPGEQLLWRFRYKIVNDVQAPNGEIYADTRGFSNLSLANYVGRPGAVVLTDTAGVWTTAETVLDVPAGATAMDLHISQIFTNFTTIPWRGSFRLDDVAIYRELTLRSDFNGSLQVDGLDLAAWKNHFAMPASATKSQGDADGDADVDGRDFLVWQREFGLSTAPPVQPVPEPASQAMLGLAILAMGRIAPSRSTMGNRRPLSLPAPYRKTETEVMP